MFLSSMLAAGCGLELDYQPPTDGAGADALTDASQLRVDAAIDAGVDAFAIDAWMPDAPDIGPVQCIADADCDTALGAPPCGVWACVASTCDFICANCTDVDHDGFGVGMGCAGLDCDDSDPAITDTSTRSCAPSSGTVGVGVCTGGTETCSAGSWGACLGARGATPESCNGLDDDCDGFVDDGFGSVSCGVGACIASASVCTGGRIAACTPMPIVNANDDCGNGDEDCDGRIDENCGNCVFVGAGGSDASVAPRVAATPMATVQAAIDYAAAVDPTMPPRVCLLAASCSSNTTFVGAVRMRTGVHVQGNFQSTGVGQCSSGMHTILQTGDATGVLFDAAITRHTELADVMVAPASVATVAGVTVDGAHSAVLSDVWVTPQSNGVTNGYGVDIRDGGDAIVQRSVIYAGHGSSEGIGVRVVDSRVTMLENCPGPLDAAGRCTMGCSGSGVPGIRGRQDASITRGTTSYAILLRNSPGSIVESSATCGQTSVNGAGIRVEGDATNVVVRGNFIAGWGPTAASYGIDFASCAGASPLVADNYEINAEAPASAPAVAIRALGDCHPIIENNVRILSGLEGSMNATAIECGVASSVASRCVIEGNPMIRASMAGFPITATGIACEGGACARIVRNDISGQQGATVIGLALGTGTTFVARNHIAGGCGTASATGILAIDSGARLENNVVIGGASCINGNPTGGPRYVALDLRGTDATRALDVHGNDFDPVALVTAGVSCASHGIELTGAPGVPVGVLRGNIVLAGTCGIAYPIFETSADADPISIEHDDLVSASGRPVYRDENASDLANAAAVDALGDTLAGGTLDQPPGFASYPMDLHINGGSVCRDADLSAGAPADDFDGIARSAPDIGAFEH